MKSASIQRYDVLRLHYRSERAWAIVVMPGGSIAIDHTGDLLMRLAEREARAGAAAMTAALIRERPAPFVIVAGSATRAA